ncbi:Haspin-like protein [Operophtera brumata]|uniref:Haspin-like protein n=1 Tax=Operophtera brumata TaxID=104452 RepID=A0A0L7LSW3_OPEBR|nr:Haspin-like protein [Operophtera brumata]
MDEKSSVFDAFYIQNIKQTKRELSCVGSSNSNGDASKKVRKKKYVKRIVKEVENMQPRESMPTQSTSTYLTPDKSIRVNKILDAFDMLLNSSSTGQVQAGDINNDVLYKVPPKKEDKKYTRKKLTRVKKLNYSSEHSSERVLCKNPKKFDESINKIVNNLSLMNNFKGKTEKSSFNTSYKHHRNKYISPILQKSTIYQNSPILQRSPFCSTPFKDKYRGKSIYNFSPISTKERVSLNYETIKEENNEINKSSGQIPKLSKEQTSPPNNISDSDSRTTSKSLIYEDEIDPLTDLCVTEKKVENEPEPITKRQIAIAEQSLFQLTEAEPFLGFSHNSVIEKITDRIQENNSDSDSNLTEGDSQNGRDQCLTKLSENGNFNKYDDDKSYRDTSLENHSEDISLNDSKDLLKTQKSVLFVIILHLHVVTSLENHLEDINFSEIKSDRYISRARNSTQDSDKESMYDTCNSEESVSEDNINEISINNRVPKVAIERMSDSVFLKFYEKMLINKEDSSYRDASMTDEVQSDIDDDQSNVDETKSQDENEDKIDSDENQSYVDESQSQDEDEESDIHDMMNDVDETESQDENGGKIDIDENDSSVDESQSQDENGGKIDIDENDSSVDESQSQDDNLSTDYENQSKVDEMQIEVDKILNEENDDEFDNKSMDDYSASFYKFSNDNISNTSKNTEYYPGETQTNEITITDSSTTEDVESSDETSTHEDEKCVSFVTTRRRNEITNDSLFIFNNSYCSSSTDCNNTILSNKARLSYLVEKSDLELDMSLHQPRTSDFNEIDACVENIEDEDRTDRISRTMTKKCLRLPRQSAVDNTVMDSSIRIDEIKAVEFSKALSTKQPGTSEHRRSSITTKKSSRMLRDSMVSESSKICSEVKPSIVLQPGKKWERSMSIYRRMTTMADHFDQSLLDDEGLKKGRKYRQSVISTMGMQDSLHNESINSRRSTFVSKPSRPTIRFVKDSNNSRISLNTTEVFDDLKGE